MNEDIERKVESISQWAEYLFQSRTRPNHTLSDGLLLGAAVGNTGEDVGDTEGEGVGYGRKRFS